MPIAPGSAGVSCGPGIDRAIARQTAAPAITLAATEYPAISAIKARVNSGGRLTSWPL
jgi:hypothetical protein